MKNSVIKIISAFTLLVIISCQKKEAESQKSTTPEVLQENSLKSTRYSKRNNDLTNLLYQDLVENSIELQNLEDEIEKFRPNDSLDEFHNYEIKSQDYYNSANYLTNKIHDSITKNKIVELIKKSKAGYLGKTNEITQVLSDIDKKENSINDYHAVLKIVLTLPIIEKYQNDNLPDAKKYRRLLKKQDSIIEKTKNLTPKL